MRVLHLLSSTGIHGAEMMAIHLMRELRSLGFEIHLGMLETKGPTAEEMCRLVDGFVDKRVLISCHGPLDFGAVRNLRRYLLSNGIQMIHSHGYKADFYSLLARHGTRARLISTCHNWLGRSPRMRLYAALDKRLLRYFDAVAAVSQPIVAELMRYVPQSRIVHIGNGIDVAKFERTTDSERAKRNIGQGGKQVIGFVGRLTREKGTYDLLSVLGELRGELPDVHLVIVGDGEERDALLQHARTLGLERAVTFAGARSDTALYYSAMDVFALPSYQEGFPMVLLEAMACAVPTVATTVGDIAKIVEDGVTGLLVSPGDTDALRQAIRNLIRHPAKAAAMGTAGNARVRRCFTSAAMAAQYAALYRSTVTKPTRAPGNSGTLPQDSDRARP